MNVTMSDPIFVSTEDNHTAIVAIATLTTCLVMLASVVAKVLICHRTGMALRNYDLILYFGVLLTVLRTICIVLAVNSGLGTHLSTVTNHQKENIQHVRLPSSMLLTGPGLTQKAFD